MVLLYGCAGRVTAKNGGLRPGQEAAAAGACGRVESSPAFDQLNEENHRWSRQLQREDSIYTDDIPSQLKAIERTLHRNRRRSGPAWGG